MSPPISLRTKKEESTLAWNLGSLELDILDVQSDGETSKVNVLIGRQILGKQS